MIKSTSMVANKNKYRLAAAIGALFLMFPAYAVDSNRASGSLHEQITREALGGNLSEGNLKAIVFANDSQDVPGSEGAGEQRRHFADGSLPAAIAYINREKTKAINLAAEADTDAESRSDALRHFGLMAHCVQDFYLHTNYIELQLEDTANKNDPYNIALVDWTKVPAGYAGQSSGKPLTGAKLNDSQDAINKESVGSAGGRVSLGGKITQFSTARELAVRETQRQWNLFETLVKGRCGSRATAVLTALRQAPVEIENKP